MEGGRNRSDSSGTRLNRDKTGAEEGMEQEEGEFQGGKAKKEGEKKAKKSLEPESLTILTKGKTEGGGKTLSRESERSRPSLARVAAAAKAGRQLQVQLLKRKAEKSKVGDESKGRKKKPSAAANDVAIDANLGQGGLAQNRRQKDEGKESPCKEEPDDAVAALLGSDVDLDSPIKTEHSTLIRLLRRRKERREKDSIKERKAIHEEDMNLKDAKQRIKEEDMKSPVILGTKKGPDQPHLLHVGTPFEVFNFNVRIISPLFSLSPGLLPLWTSGRYRSRHPFITQVTEPSTVPQMEEEDV